MKFKPDDITAAIKAALERGVADGVFPSAQACVSAPKMKTVHAAAGYCCCNKRATKQTLYDLASLTKPLATAFLCMNLFESGLLDLDSSVAVHLPLLSKKKWRAVTISHLLDHTSGLRAWLPLYDLAPGGEDNFVLNVIDKDGFACATGIKTIYSDLNYIVLWILLKKILGCSPADYITGLYKSAGINDLFFPAINTNRAQKYKIAPTEYRGDFAVALTGVVSDCNTRFMGGTSGHAGLFGTAKGVNDVASLLLRSYRGNNSVNAPSKSVIRLFWEHRRARCGHFALGWDRPAARGSLAGEAISRNAIGHLGFSGTSVWLSPDKGIIITLLTNRTYPHRSNNKIKRFRPVFNDLVMNLVT